ncbi:hypothetical protein BD31_I0933 [Candidatus Nitrosopumilus salaria BD31]|jgi:ribosomal protein L18E|uniref:Uncharacterized protein n=1 Tax=Candidatus Nitrosopumilus salarius BD31 TaxID=859350 RepID=I3D3Z1_9ARCH|nr:hypothetical protein BD31_I0933 [Candidatus Nitrosopumilus salaria BD31]
MISMVLLSEVTPEVNCTIKKLIEIFKKKSKNNDVVFDQDLLNHYK